MEAERRIKEEHMGESTLICVAARVGSDTEQVAAGYPDEMGRRDMGPSLHCLVLPGRLHFVEAQFLVEMAGAPEDVMED
jgi:diphthine synthase